MQPLFLFFFLCAFTIAISAQQKIVGYYPSWASFTPSSFVFSDLTHIICCFARPNADGSITLDSGIPNSSLIQAAHLAKVKVLLSFGGAGNSDGFATMAADSSLRAKFINNVIAYFTSYQFDGIDIDWEFPTGRQGSSLSQLVKDLRARFTTLKSTAGVDASSWLITMAVPPTANNGALFQYEIMSPYVDWYNVMDYDFSGSWSSTAQHDAPLYAGAGDQSGSASASVYYMSVTRSVPKNKIMLGVPFYGKTFNAAGLYKSYSGSVPEIAYSDIMSTVSANGWTYYFDAAAQVPYYEKNDLTKFITFDDTTSLRIKTEYSIQQQLGGIMIWSIDQDVVNNKQPLLAAIAQTMRSHGTLDVRTDAPDQKQFVLLDNYPNPFNPETKISFSLQQAGHAKLTVYDITGREVAVLADAELERGLHSYTFSARDLSSGVYVYTLLAGQNFTAKKMMVIK